MGASFGLALRYFPRRARPTRCGSEGLEILESSAHQGDVRGPNDPAKVYECLFIDLILCEEFLVVAEIAQEPIELPERAFGAVEPARE